jgi:TRAP-type C4-dicarboxylate transport system permease small subunit
VLSLTFRWSEEITVILFVFLIFLAIPIVLRQRFHICIDYFVSKLPAAVCTAINYFVEAIILTVSIILVITSFQVVLHLGKEPMSATHLPIGIIYGSVGLCGFLLAILTIRALLRQLRSSGCEEPQ